MYMYCCNQAFLVRSGINCVLHNVTLQKSLYIRQPKFEQVRIFKCMRTQVLIGWMMQMLMETTTAGYRKQFY